MNWYLQSTDNSDVVKSTRINFLRNIGEFKFNSDKNEYNVIKLEMYIWLEGWDADYFIGIPENTTITCNFEFQIKE